MLTNPQIPSNLRKPGFYGSFSTGAAAYSSQQRMLLIGPKLAAGTAEAGKAVRVSADPRADFGDGSILAEMATIARLQQRFNEIWALPVEGVGTPGQLSVQVTQMPPAGTMAFWLFGRNRRCEITVNPSGETTATVAAKIAAAAAKSFTFPGASHALAQPVTATANGSVVLFECRSDGTMLNGRPFVHFRAGPEVSPLAGCTTVTMVDGGGVPDVATALAGLTGHFQTVVSAFDDLAVADAIAAWQETQWSPLNMKYGVSVFARYGSYGALAAAGDAMNARTRILAAMQAGPSPSWAIAAALGSELQNRFNLGMPVEQAQQMARALSGIVLQTVEAPMVADDRFTDSEVNLLYFDGVTPLQPEYDGSVTIGGRVITTYQRSFATGLEDASWLDISDVMIPAYMMYFIRQYAMEKHKGTSLASDERDQREGQTRPKDYRSTCVQAYQRLCNHGVGDDMSRYLSESLFEMASDRKRIDARHAVTAATPFLISANDVRVN